MARIFPFRAVRYNPSLVRLDDVVTQPYDKISPAMQQAYYHRSVYNLVRIILGLPQLFDEPGNNDVYTRAARDFDAWRKGNILFQDNEPSVFAYEERFTPPGSDGPQVRRRGFIALGGLEEYSQGVIFRHEQTLSKPKSDRLNLLRATHAHFGQIFMLYSDPAMTADKVLFSGSSAPDIDVTDEYGVVHQVWRVSDPGTIRILTGAMADKKLIIADGHHRYETALNYSREHAPAEIASTRRNPATTLPQPSYPEAAAMMTFVNMEGEGIVILPTHRVVFGLQDFRATSFLERAKEYFEIQRLPSDAPADAIKALQSASGIAFVAAAGDSSFLLSERPGAADKLLEGLPERRRRLDLVYLHTVVLEHLLSISPEAIREQRNLRYIRDAGEAVDQVRTNTADIAFLTNPVKLNQLREVAFAGEVMPQKSTDFYPKLLSGLTIYAMD